MLARDRRLELGASTAAKAKDFARKYTDAEVEALFRLRRPSGLPLHWGHIWFLLTLPCAAHADKRRRRELQQKAASDDWTAPELYREIKRRVRSNRRWASEGRGVGGRKRKGEPGSPEYIQSLVDLAGRLTRALEQFNHNAKRSRRSTRAIGSSLTSLDQAVRRVKKQLAD